MVKLLEKKVADDFALLDEKESALVPLFQFLSVAATPIRKQESRSGFKFGSFCYAAPSQNDGCKRSA